MRVAVHQRAPGEQAAGRIEGVGDRSVGLEHMLAGEQRHAIGIDPVAVDRIGHLEAVGGADLEVLGAVAGGDMDQPRALFEGHVIGRQERHVEVVALAVERMAADGPGQRLALEGRAPLMRGDAGPRAGLVNQASGQQQALAAPRAAVLGDPGDLDHQVVDVVAISDGAVAGDGPGGGRPDHGAGPLQRRVGGADDREADVDGGRGVIVILDLGLGQGGLLDHRPQHRLGALVEAAVHREFGDLAGDLRLGGEGHGGIGVGPVADHAETLELGRLDGDPAFGEVAALGPERDHWHRVLVAPGLAVITLDLPFDRQSVTVPAGNVIGVEPEHLARAHDHVLEDLVERVADVEVAVGVGRPVVENELLAPPGRLAEALVEVEAVPAFEHLGLALRQPTLHRKLGLGQEDGGAVVGAHEVSFRAKGMGGIGARRQAADEERVAAAARIRRARRQSSAIWALRLAASSKARSARMRSTKATRRRRP